MTARFRQRYDKMMSGGTEDFTEHEVFEFFSRLNYFQINTLIVQSCPEKTDVVTNWYTCKVDKPTVKAYLKEKRNEMRKV